MNAFNFLVRVPGTPLQSDVRERSFDLRELRYFHSVARTGNFGRAARELNVSQPAVSQQVRKLEDGLGTQLLVRHGRGVMLTAAGACLRDRLDTIMQLLAAPLNEEAALGSVPGTFTLGVPAETGPLLAAQLAKEFRTRWPLVSLDIREGTGTDLEEWVSHRGVDVAVMQDPPNTAEFDVLPILIESLGLIAPVHARLAEDQRPLRLSALAGESLILPGRQHWIRRRVESAARQYGVRLNSVLQVNSVASTKVMVRNGLGCAILPLASVQDEVARGSLAFRPIGYPELISTCAIVCLRTAATQIVTDFIDIARSAMTALVVGDHWPGSRIIKSSRISGAPIDARLIGIDSSQTETGRIAI